MQASCKIFMMLLLFALLSKGFGQSKKIAYLTKKYSPAQLKTDARLACNVALAMHPVIGIYQPRSYYQQLFDSFVSNLNDSLTEKEFRIQLKLVLNTLNCGHTEVMYSKNAYREMNRLVQNYSPVIYYPIGERLYVLASTNKKDSVLKPGTEIVEINHVKVDSMIRHSQRLISHDGNIKTSSMYYVQLAFNQFLLGLYGRPDTFEVKYLEKGKTKMAKYAAIKLKQAPVVPTSPKSDSLFTRYKKAKMRYRFIDDNKTLLLKIEGFSHRKYGKAYRRLFRRMKNYNTQNLVIDLRENGGGSIANSYKILSYLLDTTVNQTLSTGIKNYPYRKYTRGNFWFRATRFFYKVAGTKKTRNDSNFYTYKIKPNKRHHFNKNVYVMMNGGSFSASCLVAAYLKKRKNTIFTGEESGGTLEGCNAGITPYYKLPQTGLRLRMPAFRISHDVWPQITGRGIFPDYEITRSMKDVLKRSDPELDKVKELIRR